MIEAQCVTDMLLDPGGWINWALRQMRCSEPN